MHIWIIFLLLKIQKPRSPIFVKFGKWQPLTDMGHKHTSKTDNLRNEAFFARKKDKIEAIQLEWI